MTAPSDIFVDAQARATIEGWVPRFAALIPRPTETRHISTRLGETRVLVGGPVDAPPVVLLHGVMASSAHALAEAWPLLDTHRVYAVDIAGASPHGPKVRPAFKGPGYAEFLTDTMDGLGLARAHVVGVSWGGAVAMKLAMHAPERLDHLALIVPGGLARGSILDGICKVGLPLWRYKRAPDADRLRGFIVPQFTTWDDNWAQFLGDAVRCFRMDMRQPPIAKPADLARFQGPTLVVTAGDDVHFPGPKSLARARQVFTNLVEGDVVPGMKHVPPTTDEFRRELCGRIARFLTAH